VSISTVPKLVATDPPAAVKLDKAGYFVIVPRSEKGVMSVEHYTYDNTLLRVIEGPNARAIYSAIIHNERVTELSHAAYLGKELARAELSLKYGFKYIQDGA
jgi:tetrahydromethanopterin S-methyltransferase subunit A